MGAKTTETTTILADNQLFTYINILQFWHHLLTLMSFQTCGTLWNIYVDILNCFVHRKKLIPTDSIDFHCLDKKNIKYPLCELSKHPQLPKDPKKQEELLGGYYYYHYHIGCV